MQSVAELTSLVDQLEQRIGVLRIALAIADKEQQLGIIEEEVQATDFWNDRERAERTLKQRDRLSKAVTAHRHAVQEVAEIRDFLELAVGEEDSTFRELCNKAVVLQKSVEQLEFHRMFAGESDANNAIVSINSGAGGTESQDWVAMLMRMYLRWCDRQEMKAELVDSLPGEEAGFKSVTFTVEGDYAYGHLKAENGIHRLVRISPFDANSRRHTSFASVFVTPEVSDDIEIDVRDADLKIDTYRAGGAGGQHVNKTDSAVRITHLPTNIVVQCQNERSQHKNKTTAMRILRSKLYEYELEERRKEMDKYHSKKKEIAWGSQIRSYVLHPYRLVKDHRTKMEIGNVDAVLDGDITPMMESYLLLMSSEESGELKDE